MERQKGLPLKLLSFRQLLLSVDGTKKLTLVQVPKSRRARRSLPSTPHGYLSFKLLSLAAIYYGADAVVTKASQPLLLIVNIRRIIRKEVHVSLFFLPPISLSLYPFSSLPLSHPSVILPIFFLFFPRSLSLALSLALVSFHPHVPSLSLCQVGVKARLYTPAVQGDYEVILQEVMQQLQAIEE
eukprot:5041339-Pleurochrysis_carterae.AAC.2